MVNVAKWFKGRKQDSELPKSEELVEDNLFKVEEQVEQEEQESEDQLFGLPSVQDGQVTLNDTGVSPADGALLVSFFISNGLSQKVKFDRVPLVLIDSEKRVLARQLFDGESIGEVACGTAKACVVRFDENNVYEEDIPEDCQVCFDIPTERSQGVRVIFQSLPDNITESQKQELVQVLAELPPMKLGELNFSPLQAQITSHRDLLATVIIRNASEKVIKLEQIPLAFFDAHREELAQGLFDIKELSIEPFKAVLWTFNFGPISEDEDIDLSGWYINVAQ